MDMEELRNRILSNLRNLKDIPEYKTISVTEDYTITERRMIKDWSDKAEEKKWITWFRICMKSTM